MNHTPQAIAHHRVLCEYKFAGFLALEQGKKYLCDDGTIGTWDVDASVDAYKAFISEESYERDRKRLVAEAQRERLTANLDI